MEVTTNILASPAATVLCDLEHDGLDVAVVGDRLRVWPVELLTAKHELLIRRDELVALVGDSGVQARVDAYRRQLKDVPAGSAPAFVFRPGTPYTTVACFSCGAEHLQPRWGRCWRCSLSWRLAARVPIAAEQAAVYDGARVVA